MFVGLALVLALVIGLLVVNAGEKRAAIERAEFVRQLEAGDLTEARENMRRATDAEAERGNRAAERAGRR
jgi:hypothetical protein